MDRHLFQAKALRDPRLAAHAIGPRGAWLFARDGSTLLWTNAVGGALFDLAGPNAPFTPSDDMRAAIVQLAARLPLADTARLERLHGFGAPFGQRTTCSCARLTFAGGTVAVLVVAVTADARPLPQNKRLAWLIDGLAEAIAIFEGDGALAAATPAALAAIGSKASLAALDLKEARDTLDEDGRAEAATALARFRLFRLGEGAETAFAAFISPFAMPLPGPLLVEPPHSPIDAKPATSEALSRDIVKVRESVSNETSSSQGGADRGRVRPLRFVWRTDADGRFTLEDGELNARMDAPTIAAMGRPWAEIATLFTLDAHRRVADALATRQTWNRIATDWPLDATRRVIVELSGAPIFDADRQFTGYRGFGLCRDPDAITQGPAPVAGVGTETVAEPSPAATSVPPGNVLRFPAPMEQKGELRVPSLSPVENSAFDEIARQLAARLQPQSQSSSPEVTTTPTSEEPAEALPAAEPVRAANAADKPLLDGLPLGILIYRIDELLYANRAFLDHAGYPDLQSLCDVGGLDVLAVASDAEANLTLITPRQGQNPAPVRQFTLEWDGEAATALVLMPREAPVDAVVTPAPQDDAAARERNDLLAIVETASDGIVMLDTDARILICNRRAEAMLGIAADDLRGTAFSEFFDAGSRHAVLEALQGARQATPTPTRDVTIRRRDGSTLPLSLSLSRLPSGGLSARMVDQSQARETESELATARRRAESAANAKSDAIGRISHDIRTPLNAIIGFADVMIGEQFGPVGNPRYLEYLRDIRASGERVAGLIDDMGNLSRAETGKIDLSFTSIALNEIVEQCAATLQPQANRERIIIRTSLAHALPLVTADARTLRQVVLNLIATSIRLNHAGGQVIVSTALTDNGDVALRVRDTGPGLSAQDVSAATEPHRMATAPDQGGASGAGISLALTRALVEANRARFDIRSAPNSGTLVEVIFTVQRQALAR